MIFVLARTDPARRNAGLSLIAVVGRATESIHGPSPSLRPRLAEVFFTDVDGHVENLVAASRRLECRDDNARSERKAQPVGRAYLATFKELVEIVGARSSKIGVRTSS